jgi:signal transduction histidine kinase
VLSAAGRVEELVVASRRKDEFLAVLSHELRNVLAPVANALQILRLEQEAASPLPNRGRMLIERQMKHLSHLVDDLLDVSVIEAGRLRLQPGRIDLRVAVQRSVETVSAANIDRHHQVIVALPHDPIWLEADTVRMEQVVVNLLSNAVKYTDDGGRITVRLSHGPGRAELRIADSGIGIAPDELALVFDPFARAEGARERSPGGLGLGLTIVQRILKLHGGSVVAHSAGLGAGSEFVVFLPLAPSAGFIPG